MTSWIVGVGLGSLDFVAAGLRCNDVGGGVVPGVVVSAADEHPANATSRVTMAATAMCFLMLDPSPSDPCWVGRDEVRVRPLRSVGGRSQAILKRVRAVQAFFKRLARAWST
jgi:hypothetical protein